MTSADNNKLYVNLSASQARKRLKGHGFGVRRVEAAGRNQSVIVHTATGGHLRGLESLFSDVLPSVTEEGADIPFDNNHSNGHQDDETGIGPDD